MSLKIKKNRESEYVFACARLHALESSFITEDKLKTVAACPDAASVYRLLSELGLKKESESDTVTEITERSVLRALTEAEQAVPYPEFIDIFRYPYDCHNLKSVIKCRVRRGFDIAYLYSPCGSVPFENVKKAVTDGDYSAFPEYMSKAAEEAVNAYAETGDSQLIDIPIDVACFTDMASLAEKSGEKSYIGYVSGKADITNIMTYLRCAEMGKDAEFFSRAFVPGGKLPVSLFEESYNDSDMTLKTLSKNGYEGISSENSLSNTERTLDIALTDKIREESISAFGPSAAIGYIVATENQAKNIRIAASCVGSENGNDKFRERMRHIYV